MDRPSAGPHLVVAPKARNIMRASRRGLLLLVLGAPALVCVHSGDCAVADLIGCGLSPEAIGSEVGPPLAAAMIAYAILLAIPFVPAVEIGIGLLLIFGPQIAVPVYLATVLGLTLSFLIGRLVPASVLASKLRAWGRTWAGDRLPGAVCAHHSPRSHFAAAFLPYRLAAVLARHPGLALAVMLNLPGNAIVGGGGGIALMAGITRLSPLPVFLATVIIAVAPVPLAVLLLGENLLSMTH